MTTETTKTSNNEFDCIYYRPKGDKNWRHAVPSKPEESMEACAQRFRDMGHEAMAGFTAKPPKS